MSLLAIALRMLLHRPGRCAVALAGSGAAFFLSAAQAGLLVGWCNTATAVIRHAGADVWVMAPRTPALDYGVPIPRNRVPQVRNAPGVAWAEGLLVTWTRWQRPDGRQINVELVGVDESSAGAPWRMEAGDAEVLHGPQAVVVDRLYLDALGVRGVG